MATSNREAVTLDADDLNDWDRRILTYLRDGRATPGLVRKLAVEDGQGPITRQYINGRMKRLEEHEHLRNLHDSGVYELVDDPEVKEEKVDGGVEVQPEGQLGPAPIHDCPDCPFTSDEWDEWEEHRENCPGRE